MDLIERYLGAVRWNLPAAKADDIVAELRDLIAARIEDREEQLDRALSHGEVSTVLREFGHPLSVAGQYHGQRALIGVEIFPFYWFALKIVLAIVTVIEMIEAAGRIIAGSEPFLHAIAHGLAGTVSSLLFNAAWVTLAFALIERTGLLDTYLARWQPEELPDLRALRIQAPKRSARKRIGEAVTMIVAGTVFLAWWFGAFRMSFIPVDAGIAVEAAPIWRTLFWPTAALVAGQVLLGLVTLFRPGWKPLRAALVIGGTAGTIAIAAILHQAGRVLSVSAMGAGAGRAAEIQAHLDLTFGVSIVLVAVIATAQCAVDLWRISQERPVR